MDFATLAEKWLGNRTACEASCVRYRGVLTQHILPTFGAQSCDAFDLSLITPWLRALCTGKGPSVVRSASTIMKSLLDDMVTKEYLKKNPLRERPLMQILRSQGYSGPGTSGRNAYLKAPSLIPNGGQMPFEIYAADWMTGDSSDRIVRKGRTHWMNEIWIPAFGGRTLESITRLDVLQVTIPLQRRGRLGDCRVALRVLSSCFRCAILAGRITVNPARCELRCLNVPPIPSGMSAKQAGHPKRRVMLAVRAERKHRSRPS